MLWNAGNYGLREYTEEKHIHVDLMQKRQGKLCVGCAAAGGVSCRGMRICAGTGVT